MVLHNEQTDIKSNVGASETFTITASAKAFDVLTDKLYKDKILAAVRELSTNALDAHVDAGKAHESFEIHLPTALEPHFSIADKGVGMDNDQVYKLYTSFFSSSKTERNDQIGALGLGSKSPFAVTDSFNIESVKDGIKGIYTCYKSPKGPQIVPINIAPTDEPNGVLISFPVKEMNFDEFVDRAARVYWAFEVQPVVTGATIKYEEKRNNYNADRKEVLVSGSNWDLYKQLPRFLNNSNVHVKMGSIVYPVSSNVLNTRNDKARFVMNNRFIINMPLGTVDIAPSREELNYDEITCRNLIAEFGKVFDEFMDQLNATAAAKESAWEAIAFVRSTLGSLQGSVPVHDVVYNGVKYTSDTHFEVKLTSTTTHLVEKTYRRGRDTIDISTVPQDLLRIIPSKTVGFVVLEKGGKEVSNYNVRARLRRWMDEKGFRSVILFNAQPSDEDLKALGCPKTFQLIEVPKLERQPRQPRDKKAKEPLQLFGPMTIFDPKGVKGQIPYIVQKGQAYYWWNGTDLVKYERGELEKGRHEWQRMGLDVGLVLVPYSEFKTGSYKTAYKWVPLNKYIQKPILVWAKELAPKIEAYRKAAGVRRQFSALAMNLDVFEAVQFSETSLFAKLLVTLQELPADDGTDPANMYRYFEKTVAYLGMDMPKEANVLLSAALNTPSLTTDLSSFYGRYPLLAPLTKGWEFNEKKSYSRKSLDTGSIESHVAGRKTIGEAVVQYIQLIDSAA
jgi:hypothetical protein